ncbi:Metallo-dependent phosphatase-like protein [Suillus ampliporus]|nr:Metallo-dependent phosphatase-like protein [Suillus ampliporus]
MILAAATLLSLALRVVACAGDHLHARDGHVHETHAYPHVPLSPPYRPLVWGDLNVIHTTDTHGWLLGHQKSSLAEPYYSGDLGDFSSFVTHMKQIAIDKDVDLLLVDSGDLHDGTGISDGYPPGGVDAHDSNKFVERLPYDLMTIGNHELYVYADTYDMYTNFVPHLAGRYLTSNVNITIFNSDGEAESVPVGDRYAKFTTRKGRRITSLGVIFNFTGNDEQWFAEAISEEPDAFVLIGHMPGAKIDAGKGNDHSISFTRRYLDQNRVTYEYHTRTSNKRFDTDKGRSITNGLQELASRFDLSYLYGTAQEDYTMFYDPYPSNGSLLSLFIEDVVPYALAINNTRASIPNVIIVNSYALRFDILKGPFTRNDQLTVMEYKDLFLYIADVPSRIANQVLPALINPTTKWKRDDNTEEDLWSHGIVDTRYRAWLEEMDYRAGVGGQEIMAGGSHLSVGYVTNDSCPSAGHADDTLHTALPFYNVPIYIGSNPPNVTPDAPIDLVFINYLGKQIVGILNSLQKDKTYTMDHVLSYSPTLTSDMLGMYAEAKWN